MIYGCTPVKEDFENWDGLWKGLIEIVEDFDLGYELNGKLTIYNDGNLIVSVGPKGIKTPCYLDGWPKAKRIIYPRVLDVCRDFGLIEGKTLADYYRDFETVKGMLEEAESKPVEEHPKFEGVHKELELAGCC